MKVVHVVGTISTESSGPSKSVPALCEGLAEAGVDVEIHYLDFGGRPSVRGVNTYVYERTRVPGFRHAAWSARMLAGLWAHVDSDTILHAHGLWHFPTIYPAWVQALRACKLVMSPRGTLGSWKLRRSWVKKAISLRIGQRRALERADMLHATSDAEADDFRRFGLQGRTVVIPNAINVPPLNRIATERAGTVRNLLFLGRIHPVKAIDHLLKAWACVESEFPQWHLSIAGPSESGHRAELQKLAQELHLAHVHFPGELCGKAKADAYRNAELFVLPSHHENFGMVVAEALSNGKPVIASRGTPWRCLVERAAGWWVNNEPASLEVALRDALGRSPAQLTEMGMRGYQLLGERFSVATIAQQMLREYELLMVTGTAH